MKRIKERKQKGFYTIEALVSIAIFLAGILGIVGLQASAIGNNSTANYRAEAGLLANSIIAEMWTDRNNLNNYASGTAPAYAAWISEVQTRLPSADVVPPIITVSGQTVTVQVRWKDFKTSQVLSYTSTSTIISQ